MSAAGLSVACLMGIMTCSLQLFKVRSTSQVYEILHEVAGQVLNSCVWLSMSLVFPDTHHTKTLKLSHLHEIQPLLLLLRPVLFLQ